MSASDPDTAPGQKFNNLTLDVTFNFDQQWLIAPASGTGGAPGEATRAPFPPGGGLTPRTLHIGPVHLAGLSADAIAKIVRRRAEDMAILAEAIAIANIQFRQALESLPGTHAAAPQ